MAENQYPEFVSGQTLTAPELNDLRIFLHHRDTLVARMVGFGVNCGLKGTIASNVLTIAPGLAIDQAGEPLMLPTAQTIALPPVAQIIALPPVTPPATPGPFAFLDTTAGGFSVVLEESDGAVTAPGCGQTGCAGHAKLHTHAVRITLAPGRVTGGRFDFDLEPLLGVEPMRLSLDSSPIGSFTALRDALVTRLTNGTQPLINPALITKLQAASIATADLPGVKGYKAGWINMVLFAALDLVRCQALMKITCDRSTSRPGVVLGWLQQVSGNWTWQCGYRHAWEPPQGFTQALLGGSCTDPCGVARDKLEAIIASYAPPDPPPPSGGGGTFDPGDVVYCPGGTMFDGRCIRVYYPPPDFPDHWYEPWEIDPLGPIWNPPVYYAELPWVIYETEEWNYFNDGVISAIDVLGRPGTEVRDALTAFVNTQGGMPAIELVTVAEARVMDGYLPSGGFSPSDKMVITVNAGGLVIATGRVAAIRGTKQVAAALPAAIGAANDAMAAAAEVRDLAGGIQTDFQELGDDFLELQTDLGGLEVQFTLLKNLQTDMGQWQGTMNTKLAGIEGSIDVLKGIGLGGGKVNVGFDRNYAEGIAEFAKTTLDAMKSLRVPGNRNFVRYTADTERAVARYEVSIAGENPREIETSTLEVLDTMRTMVKASGVDPAFGRQLDAQLREVKGMFG